MTGRWRRLLTYLTLGVGVVAGSIALALTITPYAQVTAAGQTVSVGASAPSLSPSGPGELDLFGQQLPTTIRFDGPVRPRLVLRRITIDSQLSSLFTQHGTAERTLGRALASGWTDYFIWEAAIAAGCALLLIGALAGWWRLPWRKTLALLLAGVVVVEAVDLGAVMLAAYGARARLAKVGSLEALVGSSPVVMNDAGGVPAHSRFHAVVIGDSTAAGLGNPLVPGASPLARACSRSADSYAADLASANDWSVLNLSCSGATIQQGLLGPQTVGSLTAPPQVATLKHVKDVSVVIVSIGANDVGWSGLLRACAAASACDNTAFAAYFQQQLASFSTSYLQLLQQLSALHGHPRVIVNLYYDPFDPSKHCLSRYGLTPAKQKTAVSMLNALNSVLSKGAKASSFTSVQPSFEGHALCDPDPYVQGAASPAPFHPTAAGELAIALADEQALLPTKTSIAAPTGSPGHTATSRRHAVTTSGAGTSAKNG